MTQQPQAQYTDENIVTYSDLKYVRRRPTGYVADVSLYGMFHAIKEVIDNSNDETELRDNGLLQVWFFQNPTTGMFQVMVRDNGRGVPLGKMVDCFTVLGTSGKHDTNAYQTSAGSFGQGGKAAAGMANRFRVITTRDQQIGSFLLQQGELLGEQLLPYPAAETGTIVIWEPDPTIFQDIPLFTTQGYQQIIDLLQRLSIFAYSTLYQFRLVPKPLDDSFWDMASEDAFWYIDRTYLDDSILLYDSSTQNTPLEYLRNVWNLTSPIVWLQEGLTQPLMLRPTGDRFGYDVRLYLPKQFSEAGQMLTMVNNVPMRDMSSSHIVALIASLKHKLAGLFDNEEWKKFFLDIYKLPLCCAAAIRFEGAEFSGFTKEGFKHNSFRDQFTKELLADFERVPLDHWNQLYVFIVKDVELKFNLFYNKSLTKASRQKHLFLRSKYYPATVFNREPTELYIVEGDSASHCSNVKEEHHGVLIIEGKPCNVIGAAFDRKAALARIEHYQGYHELKQILNVTPEQTDLSHMTYQKIILTTDADADGQHIKTLHLVAIYSINPRIVEEGRVYLANPPLYEVTIGKSDTKIFVQDQTTLIAAQVDHIYRNALDIYLQEARAFPNPTQLTGDAFCQFCVLVLHMGDLFNTVAGKLAIPAEILERMSHVSYALTPGRIDIAALRSQLGPKTLYKEAQNMLVVPFGDQDITFSLHGVQEELYREILPTLNRICWKKFKIFISTRRTPMYKMQPIGIVGLNNIFRTLNGLFSIKRRKGLGGMSEDDLYTTCMNARTRRLTQITSVGDAARIYEMMGNEADARRKMLIDSGIM